MGSSHPSRIMIHYPGDSKETKELLYKPEVIFIFLCLILMGVRCQVRYSKPLWAHVEMFWILVYYREVGRISQQFLVKDFASLHYYLKKKKGLALQQKSSESKAKKV